MFNEWKQEKAIAALVDEAQAIADKLAGAKPHVLDSYAATAQFWAAFYSAGGQDLYALMAAKPAVAAKFATAAQAKIAALRKARDYDSSDGLAVWMHTARAVSQPRIVPPVREIWQLIVNAGPNAGPMAQELMQDAGLPVEQTRRVPSGFDVDDAGLHR